MIKAAVNAGLFEGFKVARNIPAISHLQFVDDALIFCGDDEDQIRNVKATLLCFEAVSGLKDNFFKSELIGIRMEKSQLHKYADISRCTVGDLPTSYLGLPLCVGSVNKTLWNPVMERLERRWSSEKANYLSIGGRVTLIKATLSNLLVYHFSLFKCPASVIKRIERMQREFLWPGNSNHKMFHLVDWDSICKSKEEGGLGMKRLGQMNQALLGKWLRGTGECTDGLWRQALEKKYGLRRNGWDLQDPPTKSSTILERIPFS